MTYSMLLKFVFSKQVSNVCTVIMQILREKNEKLHGESLTRVRFSYLPPHVG